MILCWEEIPTNDVSTKLDIIIGYILMTIHTITGTLILLREFNCRNFLAINHFIYVISNVTGSCNKNNIKTMTTVIL